MSAQGLWMLRIDQKELREELSGMKLFPGAVLPFRPRDIQFVWDVPVTAQFPIDFSVTRWPEGAEL